MAEKLQFELFEEHFAQALPGAKCVKFVVYFETADGELARVGVLREGCEEPNDEL
jgi:hypothetical protein